MADSEGPSPDAKDSDPKDPAAAPKPLAPAPRANPPNINAAKDAPPAGGPPGFNDFLEWMRGQVAGEAAPAANSQRGLIPKEKKKFQRRDTEAKTEKLPDLPLPAAEPAAKEASEPPVKPSPASDASAAPATTPAETESSRPATAPPASPEPLTPRVRRQQATLKNSAWFGVLTQLAVLAAIIGSFLFGRLSVSKVAAPAPAAPAAPEVVNGEGKLTTKLLSDANAALIDQAMAAEQDSDFAKTAELLGRVKASGDHVPGLTFQMALLATFQKDYNRALPLLNNALAEGENLGDAYNLRATISAQSGLIRQNGMNDYETATKVDPFEARNFFYWGEALRRVGKDQAAIVRLKQAIDRLRDPELESLYRLKLRLAQIEAGEEKAFADEMAKHLALPNPEMDWLITAAAVEMHRGKFDVAAGYLDRAAQRGDADTFALRLRDYYLHQFGYQKELSRFYGNTPPASPTDREKPSVPADSPAPGASSTPPAGPAEPASPPPASPGASAPR